MADRQCVAVINSTPDAVDLLKDALEHAGFVVMTAFTWDIQGGELNLEAFLRVSQPKVIVYDIAPPYDRNWSFLEHLRSTILKDYKFVLTTMNVRHLEALVGRDERVYEIVGKAEDLDAIVRATKEAARSRPTS